MSEKVLEWINDLKNQTIKGIIMKVFVAIILLVTLYSPITKAYNDLHKLIWP